MTRVQMKPFYCYLLFYFLLNDKWSSFFAQDKLSVNKPELLKGLRCAGQLEGEEECASGLCYDSININNDFTITGCATESMCTAFGCALNSTTEQFVCCCTHPYCNGKSHRMVKARWKMFQNGDYKQPAPRKPTISRLLPRNVAVEVDKPNTTTHIFPPTAKPSTIPPSKSQVIPAKEAKKLVEPDLNVKPKPAANKVLVTSTTILPKTSIITVKKAVVSNATVKPAKKFQSTTIKVVNTSTVKPTKKLESTTINIVAISDVTLKEEISVNLTTPSKVINLPEYQTSTKLPKTAPSIISPISTSAEPSTSTTSIPSTVEDRFKTTKKKINLELTTIAKQVTTLMANAATNLEATSTPILQPSVRHNSNKSSTNVETVITNTKPPPSNSTATDDIKKRTTRTPIKQPTVVYQLPSSYPWYWICLMGFICAALIFLTMFACLRRCGKCRREIVSRPERLQEEENHSIGHANEGNNPIIKNGKRKVKRRTENPLIKSKHLVIGTTDESLVSRCTTVTTASSNAYSDAGFGEEEVGGRELTVIDPLLNKSYLGTLQGDSTTKH